MFGSLHEAMLILAHLLDTFLYLSSAWSQVSFRRLGLQFGEDGLWSNHRGQVFVSSQFFDRQDRIKQLSVNLIDTHSTVLKLLKNVKEAAP